MRFPLRYAFMLLLAGLAAPLSAYSQTDDAPLTAMLQIGTRVVRTPAADLLEVRLIIPPELRVYAGEKIGLQLRGIPSTLTTPPSLKFRMADGSQHDVYAGAVTLTAAYRRSKSTCGTNIVSRLKLQGCTASTCFAPEAVVLTAPSPTC